MRYFFSLLASIIVFCLSLRSQPIGSWQEHLAYRSAIDLATTKDKIYAATPFACFSSNAADGSLARLSRSTGLTETGVRSIFCSPNGTLVIAYNNSVIEIITKNGLHTINALQLKPVNGDKSIFQISGDDEKCLLSTGFGIVILNLSKYEIGDTWVPGNGGDFIKVFGTVVFDGAYYAATAEGLKKVPMNATNQADFRNWIMVSGSQGLPTGTTSQVFVCKGDLYVQQGNQLYQLKDNLFRQVYTDAAEWTYSGSSQDKILVCEKAGGNAAVLVLLPDGQIVETINHPLVSLPKKAVYFDNSLWIADSIHGLLEKTALGISAILPNSPASIGSGDIIARNADWWVATGNSLSHFSAGEWSTYSGDDQTMPAGFNKTGPLAIDNTGILWAGSGAAGLLKKEADQFTVYKEGLLNPALDDPTSYRVGGLAVDIENNLWISNSGASQGLVVRKPGGESKSFTIPFSYSGYAVSQILIDDINQKWIISPNGNGLFCYNHGAEINNATDDRWRMYVAGSGNGNLPSNSINCIAKDAVGFIWVGSSDGIGIIQCTDHVFDAQGCEAILPVVQTDQFAGYLFKGEEVQSIAVDGANRKWIGTKNGAWLISETGDKTIYHFTSANSPLINNDIRKIAIDPVDGTVIFSTASGICSFKGDATAGATQNAKIVVYPNPVPPGYNGQIAIRGLVSNAMVKITELNGRLVFQSRAAGGQLVWNGRDLQGKAISTGVYLVFISDDSRREQAVSKIVFIQR